MNCNAHSQTKKRIPIQIVQGFTTGEIAHPASYVHLRTIKLLRYSGSVRVWPIGCGTGGTRARIKFSYSLCMARALYASPVTSPRSDRPVKCRLPGVQSHQLYKFTRSTFNVIITQICERSASTAQKGDSIAECEFVQMQRTLYGRRMQVRQRHQRPLPPNSSDQTIEKFTTETSTPVIYPANSRYRFCVCY